MRTDKDEPTTSSSASRERASRQLRWIPTRTARNARAATGAARRGALPRQKRDSEDPFVFNDPCGLEEGGDVDEGPRQHGADVAPSQSTEALAETPNASKKMRMGRPHRGKENELEKFATV